MIDQRVVLDRHVLESFTDTFLLPYYQQGLPIKEFHREWWDHVCQNYPYVVLAAPRKHSKSTSITFAYVFAGLMFRRFEYALLVSRSWSISVEFLRTAKWHIENNAELRRIFKIVRLVKDSEDDIIVEFSDGHQCRMVARGAEQPLRGLTWGTKRPDIVMVDDLEDDEQVLSPERRMKLMDWFVAALLPIGNDDCVFRVVGTVLHVDSLLENLLSDPAWHARRYQAHNDDYSQILWPEKFSKAKLILIKSTYEGQAKLDKYNMEYRNRPVDSSVGFFRREDFVAMTDEDELRREKWTYFVGGDFAISTKARRDYTVFVVGGLDSDNYLHVVDVRRGRWAGDEIVAEIFSIEEAYRLINGGNALKWFVETGAIKLALGPAIDKEMAERNLFLDLTSITPSKDKRTRAQSIQVRMRAKRVKFDKQASWYYALEEEMVSFDRWKYDDQVDGMSCLGIGINSVTVPLSEDEEDDQMYFTRKRQSGPSVDGGKNRRTGY
jgi:predicted phage terminase large subunit-like protein